MRFRRSMRFIQATLNHQSAPIRAASASCFFCLAAQQSVVSLLVVGSLTLCFRLYPILTADMGMHFKRGKQPFMGLSNVAWQHFSFPPFVSYSLATSRQ